MRRWGQLIAILLCSVGTAQAGTVTRASSEDVSKLLVGCWGTLIGGPAGISYTACFTPKGRVETSVFLRGGREGFGNGGTYQLTRDKLVLRGERQDEGWFFPYLNATCDVALRPWKAVMISGCTGLKREKASEDIFGNSIVLRRWPTGALPKGMLD